MNIRYACLTIPFRAGAEINLIGFEDYFALRISAGKRLGGYLSFKFGSHKTGFDADGLGDEIDVSKKSNVGRIHNSYMAGIKYGITSLNFPLYLYAGVGYGDVGTQRSNGKKKTRDA